MMNGNTPLVRLPVPSGLKDLKPAQVFDVNQQLDERSQTLARLLKQGHFSVAPLRNPKLILHSHLPHVSSSFRELIYSRVSVQA